MLRDEVLACIGVGANLGDSVGTVNLAIERLGQLPLTRRVAASSLYRSAPVDATGPDFINAVLAIKTGLNAYVLLAQMQQIELACGRERPYRNAPRTLDLDLLLFGTARIDSAALRVPHPRMFDRAFVLQPLAEIAPELVSTAQLQAVTGQRIERMPLPG
jgi:2-amino-4-hydroxy-6-hydroxymethyldihydropteridine diphosphokinase